MNTGLSMSKTNVGYLCALTCVILWSFIPVVSRFGQSSLNNFQFLFWSNCLSLVIVFLCALFIKGPRNLQSQYRSLSLKKAAFISFLGSLGCAFYYLCLYYGYAAGNGIEVLVMQYSWPLLIVLLSVFILSERLPLISWLAIAVGFFGILIILVKGDFTQVKFSGLAVNLTVLVGALSFAIFSVYSKKINEDAIIATTLLFVGGLALSVIALFVFSDFKMPHRQELIPVIVNGALINGISYILWLKTLECIPASTAAVLVFLSPVLSTLWIVLFFHEPFHIAYAVGLLLVLASGYVCILQSNKRLPS